MTKMKIKEVKAYKSEDGCIWETKNEALKQNIDLCFEELGYSSSNTYTENLKLVKAFLVNQPDKVKYIQDNYSKIR